MARCRPRRQSPPACKEIRSHPVHGPRIRPIFSRPRLREGLASSSSPLVASAVRCARRALFGAEFLAALVPVSACSIFPRLRAGGSAVAADRRRRVDVGLRGRAGATGAWPCRPASLGVVGHVGRRWLSSRLPSELAASWKGSSMRARMTPTPEAQDAGDKSCVHVRGPRPCANAIEGYEAAVIGDVIAITVCAFTVGCAVRTRPHARPGGRSPTRYWYRPMVRPIIAHSNRQKRNACKGGIHHGHGS